MSTERGWRAVRAGVATLVCLALLAGSALTATATPKTGFQPRIIEGEGCAYVEAGPPGPRGNRLLVRGYGEPSLRRHGGEIVVDEGPIGCGRVRPSVRQVDRIVIVAEYSGVMIDERGGAFAPGATPEPSGSEIEIEIRGAETLTLYRGRSRSATAIGPGPRGALGLDLDRTDDRRSHDLELTTEKKELKRLKIYAEQGDDLIDSRRLTGFADNPVGFPLFRFFAGAGDDTILGGPEEEEILDGPGTDLIRAGGNDDAVAFGPGRDVVYGGRGDDTLAYAFIGLGPRSPDFADRLFGGPGSDFLSDRNGKPDLMRCGPGSDEVEPEALDPLGPGCESYVRR